MLQKNKKSKASKYNRNNIGLPNEETCIGAGDCIKDCYVKKANYRRFPNVYESHWRNYAETKKDDFPLNMLIEIIEKKSESIRIHDSGDFYSREYTHKWFKIAEALPHVQFYAYTKSIPLFIGENLPENFTVIFSYGGKYDSLIDNSIHRHAVIYRDEKQRRLFTDMGYIDASETDDNALTDNKKIMLKYH